VAVKGQPVNKSGVRQLELQNGVEIVLGQRIGVHESEHLCQGSGEGGFYRRANYTLGTDIDLGFVG